MFEAKFYIGNSSHGVSVDAGSNLLDAALKSGVPVSYSCRRGDCEQCGVNLISGTVQEADSSRPMEVGGRVLMCNALLQSNLEVNVPFFPELAEILSIRSPVKIHAIKRLSETVVEIMFRLPSSAKFNCLAGQYVRLTNRSKVVRSYSVASFDFGLQRFSIHVRKVDGGAFSRYLFEEAKSGDLLQLEGPLGSFFFRRRSAASTIFLATGTGIAPIYSILSKVAEKDRPLMGDVAVYWGNRCRSDAYLEDSIEALCLQRGFKLQLIFSREPAGISTAHRHVQQAMAANFRSLTDSDVYACGSSEMIRSARVICNDLGLASDRFYSDPFTAS